MNFYLLGFGQLLLDLEPLEQRIRDLFPSDNPVMRLVRLYSRVESICAPHKLSMFCNSLQLFIYYAQFAILLPQLDDFSLFLDDFLEHFAVIDTVGYLFGSLSRFHILLKTLIDLTGPYVVGGELNTIKPCRFPDKDMTFSVLFLAVSGNIGLSQLASLFENIQSMERWHFAEFRFKISKPLTRITSSIRTAVKRLLGVDAVRSSAHNDYI